LYINIHSHKPPGKGEWVLQNLNTPDEPEPLPGLYSMGIHPWYIQPGRWENQLLSLRDKSLHTRILAIGECGLDKVCNTPFPLQVQVFNAQIEWANSIGKPLVIHCVRAWEEVLALLEEAGIRVPVLFHGYNKNIPLARRITGKGYYISLGKVLQRPGMQEVLRAVPANRFFLETDEAEFSIGEIYHLAANALSIDHNSLALQIQKNAEVVFGKAVQL
jgi:TatD DNase family protein